MTRINSAIPLYCLTDEHLLAEHREIKRLPSFFEKALKSGSINNIPKTFRLGKGHVTFFLNKMEFIFNRYLLLYIECKRRGLKVKYYGDNWNLFLKNKNDFDNLYQKYYNWYDTTEDELKLLKDRIKESNSKKTHWHFYGMSLTKEDAVKLLDEV